MISKAVDPVLYAPYSVFRAALFLGSNVQSGNRLRLFSNILWRCRNRGGGVTALRWTSFFQAIGTMSGYSSRAAWEIGAIHRNNNLVAWIR